MQKLSGLLLALVALCADSAQGAPLDMHIHTPTIHEVNPQPLPPVGVTGSGAGKVNQGSFGTNNSGNSNENFGLSYDKLNMQYQQQTGTGTHTFKVMHPPQPCRVC